MQTIVLPRSTCTRYENMPLSISKLVPSPFSTAIHTYLAYPSLLTKFIKTAFYRKQTREPWSLEWTCMFEPFRVRTIPRRRFARRCLIPIPGILGLPLSQQRNRESQKRNERSPDQTNLDFRPFRARRQLEFRSGDPLHMQPRERIAKLSSGSNGKTVHNYVVWLEASNVDLNPLAKGEP